MTDDDIRRIIVEGGAAVGKSPMMPASPQFKDKPAVVDELVKSCAASRSDVIGSITACSKGARLCSPRDCKLPRRERHVPCWQTSGMRLSMDKPVSHLVDTHSVCALVLERYRIDYCTEGHRSLLSACDKHRLDPGRILFNCGNAIRMREERRDIEPDSLSTNELLLSVISHHHRYLRETLPLLRPLADRVATRHGGRQPTLRAIAIAVSSLSAALLDHITEEERTILPACSRGHASLVRYKVGATHDEHEDILASLKGLRTLCSDFTCAEDACPEQRALFAELAYLERDTKRHAQIENEVLFRRFRS